MERRGIVGSAKGGDGADTDCDCGTDSTGLTVQKMQCNTFHRHNSSYGDSDFYPINWKA
jgi:hypothetical protein